MLVELKGWQSGYFSYTLSILVFSKGEYGQERPKWPFLACHLVPDRTDYLYAIPIY